VVARRQPIEVCLGAKPVQFGFHRSCRVVVVDFTAGHEHMSRGQVKNVGAAFCRPPPGLGNVVVALTIDSQVRNGALNVQFAQGNFTTQKRLNFYSNRQFVDVEQRRLVGRLGTVQRDVVKMSGERQKLKIEMTNLCSPARRLVRVLYDGADGKSLKACALQK
jgi:hypothetical protein